MRRTPPKATLLLATVIVLAASSGYGSSSPSSSSSTSSAAKGGAKVATLASAAPSASVGAQRPRERLDTTSEEFEAMLKPYNKCMREHGGYTKGDAAEGSPKTAAEADGAKTEEANRICEPQFMPLPPWEKDPANPEARDFARDVVTCLKNRGVKYVAVSEDGISIALGGDQNDAKSISRGMDLAPECEREVAARRK